MTVKENKGYLVEILMFHVWHNSSALPYRNLELFCLLICITYFRQVK